MKDQFLIYNLSKIIKIRKLNFDTILSNPQSRFKFADCLNVIIDFFFFSSLHSKIQSRINALQLVDLSLYSPLTWNSSLVCLCLS